MEYNKQQAAPQAGAPAGHAAADFPEKPRRVRRVGTVSLGIALIFVGALMVAAVFLPAVSVLEVLKFAPLILIVLGIEVLVYSTRPDVRLKYDFLSMFLCFLLVVAAAGSSLLVQLAEGWGPAHDFAEQRLEAQLEVQAYNALHGVEGVQDAEFSVTLNRFISDAEGGDVQLAPQDYVRATVRLQNAFADADAFAARCRAVLDAAQKAGLEADEYYFTSTQDVMPNLSRSYDLWVDGLWQQDDAAAELARNVNTTIWYDETGFASERDLNDYLGQFDTSIDALRPATAETGAPAAPSSADSPDFPEVSVAAETAG